jgi:hypothetical protein
METKPSIYAPPQYTNSPSMKNNVVMCNLYIDLVVPALMSQADAEVELMAKLKTFAVMNPNLVVKIITSPIQPSDAESIYLP